MAKMTKKEAEEHIRSIKRRCRGTLSAAARKTVNALLDEGRLPEARQADRANRSGCGADFNDIIVAGPWDGETHEYKCSKCGLEGEYRAPVFYDDEGKPLFQKK